MSRQSTFSNTIHLRDFLDSIKNDPARENSPNHVEIQTDIDIFEEDQFHSHNIIVESITTRIYAYLTPEERENYVPDAFFYADGRFSTAVTPDNTLEIKVQALSLMRQVPSSTDEDIRPNPNAVPQTPR